ncbi:MAG: hypothetical protein AAGC44_08690, partial [Planctomycetota bacterium]
MRQNRLSITRLFQVCCFGLVSLLFGCGDSNGNNENTAGPGGTPADPKEQVLNVYSARHYDSDNELYT